MKNIQILIDALDKEVIDVAIKAMDSDIYDIYEAICQAAEDKCLANSAELLRRHNLLDWLKEDDNFFLVDDYLQEFGNGENFQDTLQGVRIRAEENRLLEKEIEILQAYAYEKLLDNGIEEVSDEEFEDLMKTIEETLSIGKIEGCCEYIIDSRILEEEELEEEELEEDEQSTDEYDNTRKNQ